jgi:glycosyltransferase involved in cell wall biosynthesis
MPLILVSVSAGLFGLVGAGILARALGPWLWRGRLPGAPPVREFVALIPAHQEERNLPATLHSLRAAAARAGVAVRVVVGADACTDGTEAAARKGGAEIVKVAFRNKWKTLLALAGQSGGGWVALVDSGALWPESLLEDLTPIFAAPGTLAVAPAYFPHRASRVEKLLWRTEASWKAFENASGGPVSVHGATVFYRADVFRAALELLARHARETWLNDDVALPFAARLAFPGGAVRYWCPEETERRVSDAGLHEGTPQVGRRRRMVAGNLQWAISLLPGAFVASPAAALVALRRFLRIFWAYWVALLVFGVCEAIAPGRGIAAAVAVLLGGTLAVVALGGLSVAGAALTSLLAPLYIPSVWLGRAQRWS